MAAQAAPKLLTIADTAARLGCSEMHVYRLIAAGELDPVDIAQPRARKPKTRISESDLARYIQAKTRPAPPGWQSAADCLTFVPARPSIHPPSGGPSCRGAGSLPRPPRPASRSAAR